MTEQSHERTRLRDRYRGITKAALEISYDCGGIHRDRPEDRMLRDLDRFLARQPDPVRLAEMDKWLGDLSEDDLKLVCAGEESEAEAYMKVHQAPLFISQFLQDIFEQVG